MDQPGFTASLVAGGVAGVSVDLILFPLDTIKTRLQSPQGFYKAGGFYGVYAGVPSTAIGSFPNAAAFFVTYEYVKWILNTDSSSYLMPVTHMLAASAGEVIPFSLVQFPLWESLKVALQLQSPRLWMWPKQESCWQRLVPAPQVGISSLPCMRFGGHRGCRDYLQVSSLEWQPSVWEVSSFLVLTTKLAVFCWNLAERAPESEMAPPFKKGPCCGKSFPSSEQLSSHLNNETVREVQSRSGYNMEDTSSALQAGWVTSSARLPELREKMMSTAVL
ncbi:S-adenosylmethionine mitochondrial carrier protein isoform X3 [Oryx dammah]|uniref:S-adenosylmethionine mitochondrial carrier protein isoform X3 n=1 Tax=Oryx dammah TaxID=59534 RepID=UPI001A9BF5F2|nr:S-adenosylmethionine mitochondrial carrier protein isoform X3 [Oryx dammah]